MVLLMGGCSTVTTFKGVSIEENALLISTIPPIAQDEKYTCGVACIASVAYYWGKPFPPNDSFDISSYPRDLSGIDLEHIGKMTGLNTYIYGGSMEDLRKNIEKGRPVIVMIRKPVDPTINYSNTRQS